MAWRGLRTMISAPDCMIITETNDRRVTTTKSCGHATTVSSLVCAAIGFRTTVTITRLGITTKRTYEPQDPIVEPIRFNSTGYPRKKLAVCSFLDTARFQYRVRPT
jgi:hypothetical protein